MLHSQEAVVRIQMLALFMLPIYQGCIVEMLPRMIIERYNSSILST